MQAPPVKKFLLIDKGNSFEYHQDAHSHKAWEYLSMVKKFIITLVVLVVLWWCFGFVEAIRDSHAGQTTPQLLENMKTIKDPIRKSGYRTYAETFVKKPTSMDTVNEMFEEE